MCFCTTQYSLVSHCFPILVFLFCNHYSFVSLSSPFIVAGKVVKLPKKILLSACRRERGPILYDNNNNSKGLQNYD